MWKRIPHLRQWHWSLGRGTESMTNSFKIITKNKKETKVKKAVNRKSDLHRITVISLSNLI